MLIFWVLFSKSKKPEVFGGYSLLQAGAAPGGFITVISLPSRRSRNLVCESGGVVQAFQRTDVRYPGSFSKVDIPVLDKLTLSNIYQTIASLKASGERGCEQ